MYINNDVTLDEGYCTYMQHVVFDMHLLYTHITIYIHELMMHQFTCKRHRCKSATFRVISLSIILYKFIQKKNVDEKVTKQKLWIIPNDCWIKLLHACGKFLSKGNYTCARVFFLFKIFFFKPKREWIRIKICYSFLHDIINTHTTKSAMIKRNNTPSSHCFFLHQQNRPTALQSNHKIIIKSKQHN